MFLTERETEQLRNSLETMSGIDPELAERCADLIRIEAYDEAVRSACALLEERLRKAAPKQGLSGTRLADYAFCAPDSPLIANLSPNVAEREGLHQLFSGAFKLFRNPIAHGNVSYDDVESKAIIGFVNLLLLLLKKVDKTVPATAVSGNLERVFASVETSVDPAAANRLRVFIAKCRGAGLSTDESASLWIPFITTALIKFERWDKARPHRMRLFYLNAEKDAEYLIIPVHQYYQHAVGINVEQLAKEYKRIGFEISGRNGDLKALIKNNNSTEFFDALFALLTRIMKQLGSGLERAK